MTDNPAHTESFVKVSRLRSNDAIVEVVLNRPKTLNAIDLHSLREFSQVMKEISTGDSYRDVRAIVIRGEGRTLCAGADLTRVSQGQDPAGIMAAARAAVLSVVDCPVPVITVVTGKTAGFGVSLALSSDIAVMGRDAAFVMAFVNIGLMCDGGISALLPALIGHQRAAKLLLLGEMIGAEDAYSHHMVAELADADQVCATAEGIAQRIANNAPGAVGWTKRALAADKRAAIDAALAIEAEGQWELLQTEDFHNRVAAFLSR